MAFFEKNKDKISSKYTLKRTKLHRFKKISRGSMPPNPPNNAHGFPNRKKKFLPPPLPNPGDAPGIMCKPRLKCSLGSLARLSTLS